MSNFRPGDIYRQEGYQVANLHRRCKIHLHTDGRQSLLSVCGEIFQSNPDSCRKSPQISNLGKKKNYSKAYVAPDRRKIDGAFVLSSSTPITLFLLLRLNFHNYSFLLHWGHAGVCKSRLCSYLPQSTVIQHQCQVCSQVNQSHIFLRGKCVSAGVIIDGSCAIRKWSAAELS